jgi:hypothetical protein
MDAKRMAQSPVRGLRGRVWNRIEGPLERRTPFSAETLRTVFGTVFLVLAVRRIVRAVRDGMRG